MKIRIVFIAFLLVNLLAIYAMAEPRRDSFEIRNKRWSRISVEVTYLTPRDININNEPYGWTAIFLYNNENQVVINGRNHLYEGHNSIRGRSYKEIFHYPVGFQSISEEINISRIDFIDSIPYIERLKRIIKELIIRDRRGNIILTLENVTEDMIKGIDGSFYIEIR